MDTKTLKEFRKQKAIARLSKSNKYLFEFWKTLTNEQRFELNVINIWHKKMIHSEIIKEFKKQRAIYKLSNNFTYFGHFISNLTDPEVKYLNDWLDKNDKN